MKGRASQSLCIISPRTWIQIPRSRISAQWAWQFTCNPELGVWGRQRISEARWLVRLTRRGVWVQWRDSAPMYNVEGNWATQLTSTCGICMYVFMCLCTATYVSHRCEQGYTHSHCTHTQKLLSFATVTAKTSLIVIVMWLLTIKTFNKFHLIMKHLPY